MSGKNGSPPQEPSAKWSSSALDLPKPGSSNTRFTVDQRGVNRQTVPVESSMPDPEVMCRSVAGSTVSAKIDMFHAYGQIPLHQASQESMPIQTPSGVHTPNIIIQGSTDAGKTFQAVISLAFCGNIQRNLLQWPDDFLLHAKQEAHLLLSIRTFFEFCN